jgi:hypothetical protein
MSATGSGGNASAVFGEHDEVCDAGVLFLLPGLLEFGLLKTREVYQVPDSHYYGIDSIMLTLAFMVLCRIKNPEQLKQCKPGEIGKLIGLDRIPEVRCLRNKIRLLSGQQHAQKLNRVLIDHWYKDSTEDCDFLYIDGHQRIYYGYQANLPVKYISRQKLCMSATTEYWVNDAKGQPVLVVTGELTEKLRDAIEGPIISQLQQTKLLPAGQAQTDNGAEAAGKEQVPVFTMVFDREGYEPAFFKRLWDKHRIAILTYRKNVKDKWAEDTFVNTTVTVIDNLIDMRICEREVTLDGISFREIRRLTDSGHQTSIITNNCVLDAVQAAGRMFSRWDQENFFKYMICDYDFDKMVQFGVETVDQTKEVVNPAYRKLSHKLKKEREKIARAQAKLARFTDNSIETMIDKMWQLEQKQADLHAQLQQMRLTEQQLIAERKQHTPRITLKNMPEDKRYNKLKTESKLLMNCLKMICYRAETAVANILAENKISKDEKRMIVKQIIKTNADMAPDYSSNTLTITLHSLSTPRYNQAAAKLAALLTDTQTLFPGTDLKLIFKTQS